MLKFIHLFSVCVASFNLLWCFSFRVVFCNCLVASIHASPNTKLIYSTHTRYATFILGGHRNYFKRLLNKHLIWQTFWCFCVDQPKQFVSRSCVMRRQCTFSVLNCTRALWMYIYCFSVSEKYFSELQFKHYTIEPSITKTSLDLDAANKHTKHTLCHWNGL